jgi:hypothetical protein
MNAAQPAKTTVNYGGGQAAPPPTDVAKVTVKPTVISKAQGPGTIDTTQAVKAFDKAQDKAQEKSKVDTKAPPKENSGDGEGAPAQADGDKPQVTKPAGEVPGSTLHRISQIEGEKRAALQQAQQAQAERDAMAKKVKEFEDFQALVKKDPRKALALSGKSYKELTDIIAAHGLDGALPEEKVDPKVAELQKQLDEERSKMSQAEQKRQLDVQAGQINAWLQQVGTVFKANEDGYECTLRRLQQPARDPAFADRVSEDVLQLSQLHLKETGKMPTAQFVADTLERVYEEEDFALVKQSKKVKVKLGLKDDAATGADGIPAVETSPAKPRTLARHKPQVTVRDGGKVTVGAGTIGRRMHSGTGAPAQKGADVNAMSRAERIQHAIDQANAAMKGKKK